MARLIACLLLLVPLALPAAGGPVVVGLANRLEAGWDEPSGETRVDDWMDARAFGGAWSAHVRLRARLLSGDAVDSVGFDQRDLTLDAGGVKVTAGTWYDTIGRGLVLRAYENRFVTVGRVARSFSLDRDVDGFRGRVDTGPFGLLAFSGKPVVTPASGGGVPRGVGERLDLLQGVSPELRLAAGRVMVGAAYLEADRRMLASSRDPDPRQFLREARASAVLGPVSVFGEWADIRWSSETPGLPYGRALYLDAGIAHGDFGGSFEYKDYDAYSFPYAEPPTLVRTHSSILLNASTHVQKPTEHGFQGEVVWSPTLDHVTTANLSRATSAFGRREFDFTEVYLEQRVDGDRSTVIGFADWAEDEFTGDRNRWTAGANLNLGWRRDLAALADLELQVVDPDSEEADFTNGVVQLGLERTGTGSLVVSYRWTTREPFGDQRTEWLSAILTASLGSVHDLQLTAGARPAGLVCSGGFCFDAPEFEGVEFRLLSKL